MLTDLVQVVTDDGVPLSGAYFPADQPDTAGADAILWFHGDTLNFTWQSYLELGRRMSAEGVAFLSANRRGHDIVALGVLGGPPAGYAFESVADANLDAEAWLRLLRARGHRNIVLGGHSGGALRAVWAQADRHFENVVAVFAASPGEYDQEVLRATFGGDFTSAYEDAVANADQGNGNEIVQPGVPFPAWWTNKTYAEMFHPDGRYSVARSAPHTRCPTMFIFGSEDLPLCLATRGRLTQVRADNVTLRVIDGADHLYTNHQLQLQRELADWVGALS